METTKLSVPEIPIHPEVEKISGLVPPDVDAEALYLEYLLSKYGKREGKGLYISSPVPVSS